MARGAIDSRSNGRYRARYEGPDMRWHSKTFDRKADASRWLGEQLANLNRGQWVDPSGGRLAFGEFANNWLKAKTRVKRKTLHGYRSLLDSRILPTFGRSPLARIDKAMVTQWVRAMVDAGLSTLPASAVDCGAAASSCPGLRCASANASIVSNNSSG